MRVNEKQQERLERFFEEETTWFANHIYFKYCGYIIMGCSLIMAAFPTKALDRDSFWSCLTAYMLYIYGVSMLHYRYTLFQEQKNNAKSIMVLLRYLPVSERQYRIFKFRKLKKTFFFLALFILAAKVGISLIAYHSFTVWDVVIPVGCYFLVPLLLLWVTGNKAA